MRISDVQEEERVGWEMAAKLGRTTIDDTIRQHRIDKFSPTFGDGINHEFNCDELGYWLELSWGCHRGYFSTSIRDTECIAFAQP